MEENNKRQQFRDDLKVMDFVNERNEKEKIRQEKYRAYKKARLKAQKHAQARKKQLLKGIEISGLIGVLAFGSLTAYNIYKQQNQKITLEQALESGKTLEELGLKSDTMQQIASIKERLENDEISNVDLINLAPEINEVQFDVVKSKLAHTLDYTESQIKLDINTSNGEREESVITPDKVYMRDSMFRNSDTISKDIGTSIDEIQGMKEYMEEVRNGNFDRKEAMKKYNTALKKLDKFSASEMTIDEKGNIRVEYTKASELKEQQNDNQER